MWLVGSKPIRSNVTIPTTSFLHVFFSQMMSCAVHYDIIYHPFPINFQYLRTCGVDSPEFLLGMTSTQPHTFIFHTCFDAFAFQVNFVRNSTRLLEWFYAEFLLIRCWSMYEKEMDCFLDSFNLWGNEH